MKKNLAAALFAVAMIAAPSVWAQDKSAEVLDAQGRHWLM